MGVPKQYGNSGTKHSLDATCRPHPDKSSHLAIFPGRC